MTLTRNVIAKKATTVGVVEKREGGRKRTVPLVVPSGKQRSFPDPNDEHVTRFEVLS